MRRALTLGAVVFTVACGTAGGRTPSSGIAGRVLAGPTCPVERVPPSPQCAPRPLAARLRIHPVGKRSPVEVVRSGPDGRFRVRLPPGNYVLRPLAEPGSAFPRPPAPRDVRVHAWRFTSVTITYDTGIR
jgi:hypothetical protein